MKNEPNLLRVQINYSENGLIVNIAEAVNASGKKPGSAPDKSILSVICANAFATQRMQSRHRRDSYYVQNWR